jgi:hypothetical protein
LICSKGEALEAYKSFEARVFTKEHRTGIKVLFFDRGGKYQSNPGSREHSAKAHDTTTTHRS